MAEEHPNEIPDRFREAMVDDHTPKIYANAFAIGSSTTDFFLILQQYEKPVAIIQLGFTLAKTLGAELSKNIANFEESTGAKFLTVSEMEALVVAMQRAKSGAPLAKGS